MSDDLIAECIAHNHAITLVVGDREIRLTVAYAPPSLHFRVAVELSRAAEHGVGAAATRDRQSLTLTLVSRGDGPDIGAIARQLGGNGDERVAALTVEYNPTREWAITKDGPTIRPRVLDRKDTKR